MTLRLLIAYDGSDAAADAIRAAASLFSRAHARVAFVRAPTIGIEDVALTRVAVPDSVIAAGTAEHERAARAEPRSSSSAAASLPSAPACKRRARSGSPRRPGAPSRTRRPKQRWMSSSGIARTGAVLPC